MSPRATIRNLLVGAGAISEGAHEAVQARLGFAGLRFRGTPPAIREVLRWAWVCDEQLQLSRGTMEGVDRNGRPPDGGLRCAGRFVIRPLVLGVRRSAIIEMLNKEINARLADLGGTPFIATPAELGKLVADEIEKWGKVIRGAE